MKMGNTKYLVGIPILGLILILGLSMNVSAMPYISIGDAAHNFTVVPGEDAKITLPIMIKNVSNNVKGLQFNVTYNCSMINITNITQVDIVNVPGSNVKTVLYNKLCNGSGIQTSILRKAFCVYMNASFNQGTQNRTNASILFAGIKNLSNDKCVLRIAFATYKNLSGDITIGKIKMHVKGMPNYFTTNFTLPINITVEKMGVHSNILNFADPVNQTKARVNGLIKACRGDANKNGGIDPGDKMRLIRATLSPTNQHHLDLSSIKDCIDLNGNGQIDPGDKMILIRATLSPTNQHYYNLSANLNYN